MTKHTPRALITGITGQDGSYLTEWLVAKGYQVWGLVRRASLNNLQRLQPFCPLPEVGHAGEGPVRLVYGDMTDVGSLMSAIEASWPDEVYSLASQSHVHVSFQVPEFTANVTGLGTLRLLQALRDAGCPARFFHAGSSEQFGLTAQSPQNEQTPFHPRSPYACAKVFAFDITRNYRESYGMFASNGILFNHESPRRGESFVTRKITRAVAAIAQGRQEFLELGNLNAQRDWGFAGDYVEAMWRILQASEPDDFVISTGETHSVREFCELAFAHVGLPIRWVGSEMLERGIGPDGLERVRVDARHFRPADVHFLWGDSRKAWQHLAWKPSTTFAQLVHMMVDADMALCAESAWSNSRTD